MAYFTQNSLTLAWFAKVSSHSIKTHRQQFVQVVQNSVSPLGNIVPQLLGGLNEFSALGVLSESLQVFNTLQDAFTTVSFIEKAGAPVSSPSVPTTTSPQVDFFEGLPQLPTPLAANIFVATSDQELEDDTLEPRQFVSALTDYLHSLSVLSLTSFPPLKFAGAQARGAQQIWNVLTEACAANEIIHPFPKDLIEALAATPDCVKQTLMRTLVSACTRRVNKLANVTLGIMETFASKEMAWCSTAFGTACAFLEQHQPPLAQLDVTAQVAALHQIFKTMVAHAPPNYKTVLTDSRSPLADIGTHPNQLSDPQAFKTAASHVDARVGQLASETGMILATADRTMRPGYHIDQSRGSSFDPTAHPHGQILKLALKFNEVIDSSLYEAMQMCFPGRYTSLTPGAPVAAVLSAAEETTTIDRDTDIFKYAHIHFGFWNYRKHGRIPNYPPSPDALVLRDDCKHMDHLKEPLWREWKRRKLAYDAAAPSKPAPATHGKGSGDAKARRPKQRPQGEARHSSSGGKPKKQRADAVQVDAVDSLRSEMRAEIASKLKERAAADEAQAAELSALQADNKKLKAALKKLRAPEAGDVAALAGALDGFGLALVRDDLLKNEDCINATNLAICVECGTFVGTDKLTFHCVPSKDESYYTHSVCGHCVVGSHLVPRQADPKTLSTIFAQLRAQVTLLLRGLNEDLFADDSAPTSEPAPQAAADFADAPPPLGEATFVPSGDTTPPPMDDGDGDRDAQSGLQGIDLDGSPSDDEQPITFGSFEPGD